MFRTIGHTFSLMKMSWGVLMLDKELIAFPIFSIVGIVVVSLLFTPFLLLGSADSASLSIVGAAYLVIIYIVTVFFSAALVASALDRLRGGDPNIRSGLSHALRHIHHIILWALVSAVVTALLMLLRGADRIPGARFIANIIAGVWGFFTFFVIPVMVSEGHGPITSIKRSVGIIRETWGRQITATFGFALVYVGALVVAVIPAVLIGLVNTAAGIMLGVLLGGIAIMVVQTLEGIFKAALYDYAVGHEPAVFNLPTLQQAFAAK